MEGQKGEREEDRRLSVTTSNATSHAALSLFLSLSLSFFQGTNLVNSYLQFYFYILAISSALLCVYIVCNLYNLVWIMCPQLGTMYRIIRKYQDHSEQANGVKKAQGTTRCVVLCDRSIFTHSDSTCRVDRLPAK